MYSTIVNNNIERVKKVTKTIFSKNRIKGKRTTECVKVGKHLKWKCIQLFTIYVKINNK